ncbi:MAG: DUF2497 domain-containing protein [Alphaproteobacteria bacterium]|nr:DUF2497 domain-containing protein [Alphaproteobacteria bacterium]
MIEQQPSMDEILASIRRILSPEEADAQAGQQPPVVELTEDMCVPSEAPAAEMVEPVAEDVAPAIAEPEPAVLPDDVTALDLPEHITFTEDEFFKQEPVADKTYAAPVEEPPSCDVSSPADSVLLAVLRPLLREWLDKNMPRLLERCIQQELKKERHGSSSF